MAGGLVAGLSNEDAARYSFLLATPIIGAAALLKLPELFGEQGDGVRGPAFVAALCAALTAYLSVKLPPEVLRDPAPHAVRDLLRRRRRGRVHLPRGQLTAGPPEDPPPVPDIIAPIVELGLDPHDCLAQVIHPLP